LQENIQKSKTIYYGGIPMELSTRTSNDVLIIGFAEAGSLEATNSPEFREKVAALLEGKSKVVMDLSNVTFMDSSGIGALVAISRSLSANDGELRLVKLTPAVQTVFELTRLYRAFEIYGSEEEALGSFD
jgi:anti-sigma B factor antagonist